MRREEAVGVQTDPKRMILLRHASAQDAQALYLVRYEAYLPQYGAYASPDCPCVQDEEEFARGLKRRNTYCITLGDQIVGGLVMENTGECVELREIYVLPDCQQMGVAQVALLHAELRHPAARYRARVISGEAAAEGLLRRMGYKALPQYERVSDRVTRVTMEKDASSMVTLSLEPMKREDLANAISWCNDDPQGERYRLLWLHGREKLLSMTEFSKDFAFGKHYIGAPQMDFAICAVEFGRVIGIVSLTNLDWETKRAQVDYLVLDPKWRGGRLGRRAMEQLCGIAQEQYGFTSLRLTVLEENRSAIECFLASGFAEVLRKPNVMRAGDEQPHTRILMMRIAKERPQHEA